jgi:hypothetical protein
MTTPRVYDTRPHVVNGDMDGIGLGKFLVVMAVFIPIALTMACLFAAVSQIMGW